MPTRFGERRFGSRRFQMHRGIGRSEGWVSICLEMDGLQVLLGMTDTEWDWLVEAQTALRDETSEEE